MEIWPSWQGPAVSGEYLREHGRDLGDDFGNVPLRAIADHRWIFESDYYRSLLETARLTEPTELVSEGESINLLYSCVDEGSPSCHHLKIFFAENLAERTDGQLTIQVTSHAQLGLQSIDSAVLLRDGTLAMTEIQGEDVNGEFPIFALPYLWGMWADDQTHFAIVASIAPDVDQFVEDELESKVLSRNWMPEDLFIFSRERLDSLQDMKGLRTRSPSVELSDWLEGIGSSSAFVHLLEVRLALQREVLEAAVADSRTALNLRWNDVADYMYGPLPNFNASYNAISGDAWDPLPADLQQILVEEAAKHELEGLRLAAVQNTTGIPRNETAGVEFVEFSQEVKRQSHETAVTRVVPYWLARVGYPRDDGLVVDVFNRKVAPIVGLHIQPDGSLAGHPPAEGQQGGEPEEPPILPPWPLPEERRQLASYAARNAGGPGAIFLGDLGQLSGAAPTSDQGDSNGNVPLYALGEDLFVYESPYYRSVVERARVADPTPLTSFLDEPVVIEHACRHRSLPLCRLFETYFAPNVDRRTGGQLRIIPSSYSEMGLVAADSVSMLRSGELSMATVFNPPSVPSLDILGLQGMYANRKELFNATVRVLPHAERLLAEATDGHPLIVNWDNGADLFVFSKEHLTKPADLRGLSIRSFNRPLADWIKGMGAEAVFWSLPETLNAYEQGRIDAAVTSGDAAHFNEWYSRFDYINGPLTYWPAVYSVVSGDAWASLPPDLQEIMREEAARLELEALRLAAIQNLHGLYLNVDAGMIQVEFSPELQAEARRAVMSTVLPPWIERVGGTRAPVIEVFNEAVSPVIGLRIEPDGTITDTR